MIVIKDIDIIPMYEDELVLEKANIIIEGSKIKEIGSKSIKDEDYPAAEIIDGRGKIALPGLINTHTHMGMSLFRNHGNDLALQDWLETAIYPLEEKLTEDDVYYGAMLNMVEMIKSGCTRFVDMYMFEDSIAKAAEKVGMGGLLATGFTDSNDFDQRADMVRQALDTYKDSDLIDIGLAPHAIYTVGGENYKKFAQLSEELDLIIHTHLSETEDEVKNCYKDHNKSPVQYLKDLGVLDRPTIAAHCVHLSEDDIKILKEKDVSVAHNPSSNLKLASGFAPIGHMDKADINICLGTDGSASNNNLDMVEEMHIASLLAKAVSKDPKAMKAFDTLKMATRNGAKAMRRIDLGKIAESYTADIAIFDKTGIHTNPINNPIAAMVYSMQGSDCDMVIINGQIVMRERQMINIDEDGLIKEVNERADRLINA